MITATVVLVVYLLFSNCYLHYKLFDIERDINVLSEEVLDIRYKEDKNK